MESLWNQGIVPASGSEGGFLDAIIALSLNMGADSWVRSLSKTN